MALWPIALPQIPLADGFEESADSVLLRTDMDAGPAKVRPRYTVEIKRYRKPLLLTTAQVATLETFFTETIGYGSESFEWINQRTGDAATLRITNRPAYTNEGHGLWRTTLELEHMP